MATMKDVAQLAGVSTATVSRALMNPEKVSSSTRKRVEDAVLEAGYSPNSLARNLRRNESKTIVTIVPDICDPYFSEIIRGIEDAAMEHGYLVLLGDSGQSKKRETSFVNLVFSGSLAPEDAHGFGIMGALAATSLLLLRKMHLPSVQSVADDVYKRASSQIKETLETDPEQVTYIFYQFKYFILHTNQQVGKITSN